MSSAWSLDQVLALRDAIRSRAAEAAPQRDERFHAAAAVVTSFVFDRAVHRGPAGVYLEADSIPVDRGDPSHRTLKHQVRTRVLAGFSNKGALLDLLSAAAVRPRDLVQRTLEVWLHDGLKPLDVQTSEELTATLQIVDWFSASLLRSELPDADTVRTRVAYAAFLDPLRNLVGTRFRGRKVELGLLEDYVASEGERPPLLVYGPGGMGKSALLAKLLLENLGRAGIVYLDCDRPGLVAERPLTLLAEAVRQLALQFPSFRAAGDRLRSRWLEEIALGRAGAGTSTQVPAGAGGSYRHAEEFGVFVHDLGWAAERRMLLVVDTFEEVQYRSQVAVQEVFELLATLQRLLPNLRTTIAGRNSVPHFESQTLELGELDNEAADELLKASGVHSAGLRAKLSRLLRGNPLSLQLAADVLTHGKASDLDDLDALADDAAIQGVLYGRVLGHIHTDEVRRIAHPGLILRYVTADIIRRVLAEPCGLDVPDDAQATKLFDLLRNELSLVTPEGEALRHRADVRRVMLQALKKDQGEKVRRIEEAAVQYFAGRDDDNTWRAEEIYHRLSLGHPASQIEPRWRSGIEDALQSALDDLEGPARTYLASKLGVELYDEDWDSAEQATWERYVAKGVAELLRLDRPLEVLRLLRRRVARLPESPLYWFQTQALYRSGQRLEAREVARQAIASLLGDSAWAATENRAEVDRVIDWFVGPECSEPPSAATVWRQVGLAELLAPLRARVSRSFVGRDKELNVLENSLFDGLNFGPRAPLLVYGPAGAGKSTLVARFVLDQMERLALVHIDCERRDLTPERLGDPLGWVIAEASRQLALQFPVFSMPARDSEERVGNVFLAAVSALPLGERYLLFVFDHFEAMLHVRELYRFVAQLNEIVPRMRAIFVGRAAIADLSSRPFNMLALGRLDAEAARSFLAAEGIEDASVRDSTIRLVGADPYSLRLAADALRQAGPQELQALLARPEFVTSYLFRRVLSRIPDPDVRRIAVASLVLRHITPELVHEVLAAPAGVAVDSNMRVIELFEALKREVSLFTVEDDALRLRSDLRRALLSALQRDEPVLARAVGEATVSYYAARTDPRSRAEEVYHRLLLGQSSDEIDARWIPGIEDELGSSADELHGSAKAYVAARLGLDVAEVDWARTDQRTWETYAASRARALMNIRRYLEAVELLRQRSTRLPRSQLFALEAEALFNAHQTRDALLVARSALSMAPDDSALAEIIRACERKLGVEQTIAPRIDTRTVQTFHVRRDVGPEAIVEALAGALPTATDALNAFRDFDFAPGSEGALAALVARAIREDRLDELVTAAATYAPDAPALQALLAPSIVGAASSHDPFAQVWLGNRPLFNRQVLRKFISNLAYEKRRYRVLAVSGPHGSGKSYTSEFVDYVVRATDLFSFALFRIELSSTAHDVSASIFSHFGWRLEAEEETTRGARAARRLAAQIAARARYHHRKVLLFFDVERDAASTEVFDFLLALAIDPDGPPVILSGLELERLPPISAPYTMHEVLGPLSSEDIELGVHRIEIELGLPGGSLRDRLPPTFTATFDAERSNSALNRTVRELVYELKGLQS